MKKIVLTKKEMEYLHWMCYRAFVGKNKKATQTILNSLYKFKQLYLKETMDLDKKVMICCKKWFVDNYEEKEESSFFKKYDTAVVLTIWPEATFKVMMDIHTTLDYNEAYKVVVNISENGVITTLIF